MATFEIIELNKQHHVINEHVELAKAFSHQGAASYVNAVLHDVILKFKDNNSPLQIETVTFKCRKKNVNKFKLE